LKTPTEEIWPGVSQLPDYKATFPNWIHNNLTSHIRNIEEDGLDLLQVMNMLYFVGFSLTVVHIRKQFAETVTAF
jgi:hypothetical protein